MYSDDQSRDIGPMDGSVPEPQRDAVPEQAYADMPRESPWRKVAAVAATVSAGFFGMYVVHRVRRVLRYVRGVEDVRHRRRR